MFYLQLLRRFLIQVRILLSIPHDMCIGHFRDTVSISLCVCFLAVYNKAQAQRISNREFKLWTFLRGTEYRVATFLAETCVMSHQSLSRQAKSKYESPTAVEFRYETPKSVHGSSENV